jgi:hypothetical protein
MAPAQVTATDIVEYEDVTGERQSRRTHRVPIWSASSTARSTVRARM